MRQKMRATHEATPCDDGAVTSHVSLGDVLTDGARERSHKLDVSNAQRWNVLRAMLDEVTNRLPHGGVTA